MISDVRMKARMRLTNVLEFIAREAAPGGRVLESIVAARTRRDVAEVVQQLYRGFVSDAFPGCRVEFARKYVYLWLPDLYPSHKTPIISVIQPIHVEVFHPKGLDAE